MINISSFARRSAVLLLLAAISSAQAQWTSSNLHPAGATESVVRGADAGFQAGEVFSGGTYRASLWSGTAASYVDLSPLDSESSGALSIAGTQQGGFAVFDSQVQAGIWSGTAGSFVNLHPAGADYSSIAATDGTQQVGTVIDGPNQSASLWTGTPGVWTDLNPVNSLGSAAFGVGGGQQVGSAVVECLIPGPLFGQYLQQASLWTGTAESWVSLHPENASSSNALAAKGGFQVGDVTIEDEQRATRWSGTAASAVNLHPATAVRSSATALDLEHQVGYAVVSTVSGDYAHASLWRGSDESWVDLHAFLPAGFTESFATSVYHTPTSTVVSGYGYNDVTNQTEALRWVGPPLTPPISWSGFLQPINQNGTSIFKLGRVIPVLFRLTGPDACNYNLIARLYVARVTDGEVGEEVEAETICDEDSGGVFHYFWGHYYYFLGTRWMSKGTWRLRVDLGDGVEHAVIITLRK